LVVVITHASLVVWREAAKGVSKRSYALVAAALAAINTLTKIAD
jgi:hypothetical protein